MAEPPYGVIHDRLKAGRVIPFLGAGASLGERDPRIQPWNSADSNHLPNATELADYLAKSVKFPSEEETRELTKVSKYYELMVGRDVLDEELHKLFAAFKLAADEPGRQNGVHACLASNPSPLLIISTNYDSLMESALDAQGREYDVVIHLTPVTLKRATNNERADSLLWRPHKREPRFVTDDDLAEIDLTHTFVVYKIHGSTDNEKPERDSYVITEDDYIDFLTRMTSQSANTIPSFVAQHMAQCNLLFLGYGLRDWNLRVLLNQMNRLTHRSLTSWAVQYNPSWLEEKFWTKRGVEIFDMKVEDFVKGLSA